MKVLKVAGFASVQDMGRSGFLSSGVGTGGAMDMQALRIGNAALKNPESSAAIELLGALSVEFRCESNFIITGANYRAKLNSTPIKSRVRYAVKPGDILELEGASSGLYGYLCVSSGIDVPLVLGSRSQSVSGGFGGFYGRFLQANDELKIAKTMPLSQLEIPANDERNSVRLLASSEWVSFFMPQNMLAQTYTLSKDISRMGYRLKAQIPLKPRGKLEMPSHGVKAGTIQVPPSGEPIVLMRDAQTTGGYPKIATVIEADLGVLAQKRPNDSVKFELISVEKAIMASKQIDELVQKISKMA